MLTVLIADDEKKVGMLVKELIDWDRLPLQFVDIVQDGQTAYEVIVNERPDIVITDIRMPKVSGLEMIERVTKQGIKTHFIVISGYRYFEYAQKALKYGVVDYLLKPIDETELNRILEKVCELEKEKQKESERVEDMRRTLINSKYIRHKELLNTIIANGGEEPAPLDEVNKEYGVKLDYGIFRAVYIKVDRNIQMEKNEQQENIIIQKLLEIVERELRDKVTDMVLSARKAMGILVLLNYSDDVQEEMEAEINRLFIGVKEYIGDFINYDVTMGVSRESNQFSVINQLLEMAGEAIYCRIYQGTGKRIDSYYETEQSDISAGDIVGKYQEELERAVGILDERKACEYVTHCFEEIKNNHAMACEIYEMGVEMAFRFLDKIHSLFGEPVEKVQEDWAEIAEHCKSLVMMETFLKTSFSDTIKTLKKKREEMERQPIQEAVEYIKSNYGQKILLEDMAERLGFNANYFCEIFKNETGKNFSAYLLEVRMEEAKKLLRDTKDAVYEIAAKVGYKDAKFFSQQFVKVVGIKPNEYRKLYY